MAVGAAGAVVVNRIWLAVAPPLPRAAPVTAGVTPFTGLRLLKVTVAPVRRVRVGLLRVAVRAAPLAEMIVELPAASVMGPMVSEDAALALPTKSRVPPFRVTGTGVPVMVSLMRLVLLLATTPV